jgi:hypothetical protein
MLALQQLLTSTEQENILITIKNVAKATCLAAMSGLFLTGCPNDTVTSDSSSTTTAAVPAGCFQGTETLHHGGLGIKDKDTFVLEISAATEVATALALTCGYEVTQFLNSDGDVSSILLVNEDGSLEAVWSASDGDDANGKLERITVRLPWSGLIEDGIYNEINLATTEDQMLSYPAYHLIPTIDGDEAYTLFVEGEPLLVYRVGKSAEVDTGWRYQ